jgi:hypothetical protein
MRRNWILRVLGFALLAAVFVAAAGEVVMLLWNWLLPSITGWRAIGFWEALGLLVLARILFGGLRGRGRWHWHGRWHRRWESMTPQEREKFREGMRARCGWRHDHRGEESKPPVSSA